MSVFERYLTVWVFLCIVIGITLGQWLPGLFQTIGRLEIANVNLPVGLLIWVMIIPMLLKVDFAALGEVRQHIKGIGVTLFVNWLVKPFSMALLGWIFIRHVFAPYLPAGQTDSERAFCWIMQELAKSHAALPSTAELSITLRELVLQISRHGTFNFLLSNGQALWAHASTNLHFLVRQHPFSEVHLRDEDVKVDLAELNGPLDRLAIVVTEPLTTNETWTRIAPGEMVTFLDGSPLAAACVRPGALAA